MSSTMLADRSSSKFLIWKTILIKGSVLPYPKELTSKGFRVSKEAELMLTVPNTMAVNDAHYFECDLVKIRIGDLFPEGSSFHSLCAKTSQLGLALCPQSVGPMLRLHYPDQPPEEYLRIAMQPHTILGCSFIFGVDCDLNGPFLIHSKIECSAVYDPDFCFIFLLPRT
jgi:hypothetical protein